MQTVADTLVGLPALRHISPHELAATSPHWELRTLRAGHALWEAGDPANAIAVLAEGEIAIEHGGATLGRVLPGEILGETATCIPMPPRSLTLRARTPSRVLVLPVARLLALRGSSSGVYNGLLDLSHHSLLRQISATDLHIARTGAGRVPAPRRTPVSPLRRLLNIVRLTEAWGPCPPLAPCLRSLPGFAGADHDTVEALAPHFAPEPFELGQILCLEGEPGDGAWLIASGSVDVLRNVRGGRAERLANLTQGALVGVNSLLGGAPRTASCVATSRGWVYRITPEACKELLGGPHGLAWRESLLALLTLQLQNAGAAIDATAAQAPAPARRPAAPPNSEAEFRDLLTACGYRDTRPPAGLGEVRVLVDDAGARRTNPRRR